MFRVPRTGTIRVMYMKKLYFWMKLVLWANEVTVLASYGGLLFLSKFRHTGSEPVDIGSATHQNSSRNWFGRRRAI